MHITLLLFSFLLKVSAQDSTTAPTQNITTTTRKPGPEISAVCVDCLSKLQPITGCRRRGGVDYCGPFQMTYYFFMDCYQLGLKYPTVTGLDSFKPCALDMACASECVRTYHNHYAPQCLSDKRRRDGNQTKDLICADFGRIHSGGPFSCGSDDSANTVDFLFNMTDTCGCMTVYGRPDCPIRPKIEIETDAPTTRNVNDTLDANSTTEATGPKFVLANVVPFTTTYIEESCLNCLAKLSPINGCQRRGGVEFCGPLALSEPFYKDCTSDEKVWYPPKGQRTFRNCATNINCAMSCVRTYHNKYAATCLNAFKFLDTPVTGLTCADFGRIHSGGPYSCGEADAFNVKLFIENMTMECGCQVVHGRPCSYLAPKVTPTTPAPITTTTLVKKGDTTESTAGASVGPQPVPASATTASPIVQDARPPTR